MGNRNISQDAYAKHLREAILSGLPHPSVAVTEPDYGYWPAKWGDVYGFDIELGQARYLLQLGWSPKDAMKLPYLSLHRESGKEKCQLDSDFKCQLHSLAHGEETGWEIIEGHSSASSSENISNVRTSRHAKALANLIVQRIMEDLTKRASN